MPQKAILPRGWPQDVQYLTQPQYTSTVTTAIRQNVNLVGSGASAIPVPSSPCQLVSIKAVSDPAHPAHLQSGLFAAKTLEPNSLIILYIGLVHSSVDTDPESSYDLSLDSSLGIGVDATKMGNEARFINDYRGIAEKPNAEFKDVWVRVGHGVERRVGVFVLGGKGREKGIKKGQEILVSYGKGFWNARKGEQDTSKEENLKNEAD
jgi:hypothetical protein